MKLLIGFVTGLFMFGIVGMANAGPIRNSANGHYYEYVLGDFTWEEANHAADVKVLANLDAHLATISSMDENNFIHSLFRHDAWLGGTDKNVEGVWEWVTGEEWIVSGPVDPGDRLPNWHPLEPNNSGLEGEDYLHMIGTNGLWNDERGTVMMGYIVEYQTPVPEPATMLLFGLGLLGLAGVNRRKQ